MTRIEAVKITRRLWNWLAEDGTRKKPHWPEWESNNGTVETCLSECACCEYTYRLEGSFTGPDDSDLYETHGPDFMCLLYCPLDWPNRFCAGPDGLFTLWDEAPTPESRAGWAKMIAELPERLV